MLRWRCLPAHAERMVPNVELMLVLAGHAGQARPRGFTEQLKRDLVNRPGNLVEYERTFSSHPTTGKFAGLGAHVGLLDTDRVNLVTWLNARFGEAAS